MPPQWYFSERIDADRPCFLAYADANGSCSRYVWRASDGAYVEHSTAGVRGANFAEVYKAEIRQLKRLGELSGRPNLNDAVKKRKLPGDVLGEVKRLLRSMHGIQV